MDSEITIWGLTSLTDFYKSIQLLFKKQRVRLSKENLICSSNEAEIHIFNSWRHWKILLLPNQLQDSTFLFEINSGDIGISKLVSQLKLLSNLFELKENYSIVMSTIIKKIRHEIEAC